MSHVKARSFTAAAALGALVLATISLMTYADSATVVHMRMDVDLTGTTASSDCPDIGDVFITSGVLHLDGTAVENQNSVHAEAHINSQSVTGIDVVTGASYRVITIADVEVEVDLDPVTQTGTQTVTAAAKLVGQGSAPNENAHFLMHFTVDANGNITSSVDKITIDCQ